MQEWYRSRALYEAIQKLLDSGKFEDALKMAETIPDKVIRSKSFSAIAIEAAKKGVPYEKFLERAIEAAIDIDNTSESTKALMSLAFELMNLGKIDDAKRIASFIRDPSNRSKMEAEIALKLAKEGKISEAMEIINNIIDEDVRTWATSRLASQL
ncbi:MAG: hypothetical protein PWQ79_1574 [Thermococcaceae archaeon]|nr:hypothetical protein [Thermococcaceae archaeon]